MSYKCPFCQVEMKLLNKFLPRSVRPFEETASTTTIVALAAFRKLGKLIKREESDVIYPKQYLCPECGNLQTFLKPEDIKHVLRSEEDITYV